jgi:phage terminase large subunit-like protein
MEADRRRFFLNEIVVGQSVFVDPIKWDLHGANPENLAAGTSIALGFDGAKYRDATALVASRISDGKLFELRIWERPKDAIEWKVPSEEVDQAVADTFAAYKVAVMFADPYRWQDYLDTWAAKWPDRVVEFPTNVEQRMDKAIERFTTAFAGNEIDHDGSEILTAHAKNAVIVKGSRKKPRPGEDELLATHYLKMAKRGFGLWIDGAVAAVLAHEARAHAIEHGLVSQSYDIFDSVRMGG